MSGPQKRFRFQAKNVFLTYPRCSIPKDQALELIKAIQCPSNKKFIRVSRELHEDGEPHLHVLIQFEGKIQLYNSRHFDLTHPNSSAKFHPNIQGTKSSSDVKSYIEKDGDYIDWGDFQIDGRSARGGQQTANDAYAAALNTGKKDLALQVLREQAPKDFVLQYHNLNANLDKIFEPPPSIFVSKWNPDSFKINDDMEQWLGEFFLSNEGEDPAARPRGFQLNRSIDRPASLIIEGPSRLGKTQWARSLGTHNYIMGHLDFNPKLYSNDVEYNVIDDVAPSYLKLKHWHQLLGAQQDWITNIKYSKPRLIKGGIPCIVLCNPGEGSSYKDFLEKPDNQGLRDWTLKNAIFTFLTNPLFNQEANQTQAN